MYSIYYIKIWDSYVDNVPENSKMKGKIVNFSIVMLTLYMKLLFLEIAMLHIKYFFVGVI